MRGMALLVRPIAMATRGPFVMQAFLECAEYIREQASSGKDAQPNRYDHHDAFHTSLLDRYRPDGCIHADGFYP
jgi:hypothetical protein